MRSRAEEGVPHDDSVDDTGLYALDTGPSAGARGPPPREQRPEAACDSTDVQRLLVSGRQLRRLSNKDQSQRRARVAAAVGMPAACLAARAHQLAARQLHQAAVHAVAAAAYRPHLRAQATAAVTRGTQFCPAAHSLLGQAALAPPPVTAAELRRPPPPPPTSQLAAYAAAAGVMAATATMNALRSSATAAAALPVSSKHDEVWQKLRQRLRMCHDSSGQLVREAEGRAAIESLLSLWHEAQPAAVAAQLYDMPRAQPWASLIAPRTQQADQPAAVRERALLALCAAHVLLRVGPGTLAWQPADGSVGAFADVQPTVLALVAALRRHHGMPSAPPPTAQELGVLGLVVASLRVHGTAAAVAERHAPLPTAWCAAAQTSMEAAEAVAEVVRDAARPAATEVTLTAFVRMVVDAWAASAAVALRSAAEANAKALASQAAGSGSGSSSTANSSASRGGGGSSGGSAQHVNDMCSAAETGFRDELARRRDVVRCTQQANPVLNMALQRVMCEVLVAILRPLRRAAAAVTAAGGGSAVELELTASPGAGGRAVAAAAVAPVVVDDAALASSSGREALARALLAVDLDGVPAVLQAHGTAAAWAVLASAGLLSHVRKDTPDPLAMLEQTTTAAATATANDHNRLSAGAARDRPRGDGDRAQGAPVVVLLEGCTPPAHHGGGGDGGGVLMRLLPVPAARGPAWWGLLTRAIQTPGSMMTFEPPTDWMGGLQELLGGMAGILPPELLRPQDLLYNKFVRLNCVPYLQRNGVACVLLQTPLEAAGVVHALARARPGVLDAYGWDFAVLVVPLRDDHTPLERSWTAAAAARWSRTLEHARLISARGMCMYSSSSDDGARRDSTQSREQRALSQVRRGAVSLAICDLLGLDDGSSSSSSSNSNSSGSSSNSPRASPATAAGTAVPNLPDVAIASAAAAAGGGGTARGSSYWDVGLLLLAVRCTPADCTLPR